MPTGGLPSERRRLPSGKGSRDKKCWTCKWWEGPQGRSWTSDGKHCLNPNGPYHHWFPQLLAQLRQGLLGSIYDLIDQR